MPDLDDFYAFNSTSSGGGSGSNGGGSGSGGNEGCLSVFIWAAAILSLIWIIGALFG